MTTEDKPERKPRSRARRGRGEGSIFQRKDGSWSATVSLGTDAIGKRVRKTVYGKTKDAVQKQLAKLQVQQMDGSLSNSGKMTVGDLLDRFLQDCSRLNTQPNTHNKYESIVKVHLKPQIGGKLLSKLMPLHIQAMLSKLEADGAGNRTRVYCFSTIRRALNIAMKWGLVTRNVCHCVDIPKTVKPKIDPLSEQQARELLRVSDGGRYHALFVLGITAGLRKGELLALRREDVDLDNATISVRHSLEDLKGVQRLKEPKSASGKRVVKLSKIAIDAMWAHYGILMKEGLGDCEIVFPWTDGTFIRKWQFDIIVWKKNREAAGIPNTFTFHDTRHTCATILLKANIHPKVVQERLGHASIKMTMDTYSHLMPSLQENAAATFDSIQLKVAGAG